MENQEMEKVTTEVTEPETANETAPAPNTPKKKSLKWLWITIALAVVAGIAGWCIYNGVVAGDVKKVFEISALLFGIFVVTALGYLLGRIEIKGVSLGTAGVFIVAILFGLLCTFIPEDLPVLGSLHLDAGKGNTLFYKKVIQNIGLVMFVGAVGFIAGPRFFRDLKKNFKTYILMGVVIILSGVVVAVCFALIPGIGSDFSAGVLSGALTTTPGYSAALEVEGVNAGLVTLGHAIAYPFGVIGVVLFVQLMPKFLKSDMNYERSLLKTDVIASTEEKKSTKKLFHCDEFGFMPIALAIVAGLLLGAIKIPLFGDVVFTLGTTGGVLIMCLVFGHFGRIGKLSLEVPSHSAKVLRELGLMLFLIGAGVDGGVSLIAQVSEAGGAMIIVWGFIGGALMTTVPMIVGFFLGKKVLKLPLLNCLGSITGGMTSTPALGTLIGTAKTEDVAGSYASTYPIALVLIVISCNLMITLI